MMSDLKLQETPSKNINMLAKLDVPAVPANVQFVPPTGSIPFTTERMQGITDEKFDASNMYPLPFPTLDEVNHAMIDCEPWDMAPFEGVILRSKVKEPKPDIPGPYNLSIKAFTECCILEPKDQRDFLKALGLPKSLVVNVETMTTALRVLFRAYRWKSDPMVVFADCALADHFAGGNMCQAFVNVLKQEPFLTEPEPAVHMLFNTLWVMLYGGVMDAPGKFVSQGVPTDMDDRHTYLPIFPVKGYSRGFTRNSPKPWAQLSAQPLPLRCGYLGEHQHVRLAAALGYPNMDSIVNGGSQVQMIEQRRAVETWYRANDLPPAFVWPTYTIEVAQRAKCLFNRSVCLVEENAVLDPTCKMIACLTKESGFAHGGNRLHAFSRSTNVFVHRYGWLIKMVVWFSCLQFAIGACVMVGDNKICNLADYISIYGQEHSKEGPYRVCFGDTCVLRYRIGSNKKTDPHNVTNIYPYRCPSPDWEPKCNSDTLESQCHQCGCKCHGGYCEYSGHATKRDTISTIHPSNVSIILDDRGVTFPEYRHFFNGYRCVGCITPGSVQTTQHLKHHHVNLWKTCIASIYAFLGMILVLLGAIAPKWVKRRTELADSSDTNELEVEDGDFIIRNKIIMYEPIPRWVLGIGLTLLIAALPLAVTATTFETSTLMDWNISGFSTFELPSSCSCTNAGEVNSMVTCNAPCDARLSIMDIDMTLDFALREQCTPMYLIILNRYTEQVRRACLRGSDEASHVENCNNADVCDIIERNIAGYADYASGSKCRWYCAFGSVTRRWATWSYEVHLGKYCSYTLRSDAGIHGLPSGVNYTANVNSQLLGQATVFTTEINGLPVNYKVQNGDISSDRAWLVTPDCMCQGKICTSCWLHGVFKNMLTGTRKDCGSTWSHSLPSFWPLTISTACSVQLTFSNMRCWDAPRIHVAKYVVVENVTFIQMPTDGMVGGLFGSEGELIPMPTSWNKCANCTATEASCSTTWTSDGQCMAIRFNETIDNGTIFDNDEELHWQLTVDNITAITAGCGIIIGVIMLIIIIVIACKCCPRQYGRV